MLEARRVVGDVNTNFCFSADGEATAEVAFDADPTGQLTVPSIKYRDGEQCEIIGKREPAQHGVVP